ncbi:MAG: hypothetical protein WAX14_08355 [Rhodococcus sp. (in: high G+C Gram-positive bacteria)]|uniref:hypothetical protein n=1 Tax=Rhodococcus sp. TaxID=1831 RepID=UPI003BB65164
MTTYDLCHPCAAAIVNDDYSGLEFYSDDLAERVRRFARTAGYFVLTREISSDSACDACHQSMDGHGHAAETLI